MGAFAVLCGRIHASCSPSGLPPAVEILAADAGGQRPSRRLARSQDLVRFVACGLGSAPSGRRSPPVALSVVRHTPEPRGHEAETKVLRPLPMRERDGGHRNCLETSLAVGLPAEPSRVLARRVETLSPRKGLLRCGLLTSSRPFPGTRRFPCRAPCGGGTACWGRSPARKP